MDDPVNHPSHYTDADGGIECIEAIEASMAMEAFKGFLKGNCQKYLWRYEKKNGAEDLKKARWYLERLIGIVELEEAMEKASKEAAKEVFGETVSDPDAYMISGCPDGFCPMPGVRQGPPENGFQAMFQPVN
jgi:hypothetical protein